jgi:L-cysteine:1D-myo-inositol 2-amino-2-deoxy-alpha-D-glucopyranoside ligase
VAGGVDPAAIRLALLAGHYRTSRDWTPEVLVAARHRLGLWRSALASSAPDPGDQTECAAEYETLGLMRRAVTLDLDSPAAINAVDRFVAARPAGAPPSALVGAAVEALLGIDLG